MSIFIDNFNKILPIVKSMVYISVVEFAKKFNVSERTIRNYCCVGKIEGAFITGKTWNIPIDAILPSRTKKANKPTPLLKAIREQKEMKLKGGIYHRIQIDLTYNSNHIEGSRLTQEQTRYIFETNTLGISKESVNVDDIIETINHFHCIDTIINHVEEQLSESFIKVLHKKLKEGTSDSRKEWFESGDYKRIPNEVGGEETCLPQNVHREMVALLKQYNSKQSKLFEDIIEFHYRFEAIHPFQDGNGRVGRLILFKECLANGFVPFIITDEMKMFYYKGLQQWKSQKGYLLDTCLSAQDNFNAIMDYFKIRY